MDMRQKHELLVNEVSCQVKDFYLAKKQARIYHGNTNSTRPFKLKVGEVIDVSKLNNILEINVNGQYVLVEPNVSMDKLTKATLEYNMVPPVVMEFPSITVGGAIQGGAGESSSFKFGLFQDICTQYEIILGDGRIIEVSPSLNSDLYFGTAGSYGSLGVITAIKLKLIPAKKFVELQYFIITGIEEGLKLVQRYKKENIDFIDGILFSKNHGIIMIANLTNEKRFPLVTFHNARDEWFYLHVKNITKKYSKWTETIPLQNYLFRYDRGAFWMGKYSFQFLKIPFNRLTRCIFNVFSYAKTLYRSLHIANLSQQYIIQDFCLPLESISKFLEFSDEIINIYPIWLCPLKVNTEAKLSANYLNSSSCMNIGIYGKPKNMFDMIKLNQGIEIKVKNLGGRKWLYAHTYYSNEEFWNIYDWSWYSSLRKKYNAETVFPDIHKKVYVKGLIKPSIGRAIFKFIQSPFKLHSQ